MTDRLRWSNWSGKVRATPAEIVSVADEKQVLEVVHRARREGLCLRSLGSAHSHSPLVATDSILLDLAGLNGIVATDAAAREVVVRAGTKISALGPPLREAGLALRNQGDIDRQSIAGAAATGTHGTGPALQNFSATLLGARIVLAEGEVAECDATHEPEIFQALRLSLGALGVVCELRLSVRDAYRLEEQMWLEDLDSVLERLDELTCATRHFEFFW